MAASGPFHPKPSSRSFGTVVISTAAAAVSDVINLTGLTLSSIQTSTDWTAADIGFKGNVDGSTNYYPMFGSTGDRLTFVATASQMLVFDPARFAGVQVLQLTSQATDGTPVAQGVARTLKLGLSEYVEAN